MKYIIVAILAILALIINFKAKPILEKLLKKEESEKNILKMKILAFILCILDFILVLIWF